VAGYDAVHVDVGTGDGSYVYRSARACPGRFFVGVDSNGAGRAARSRRAGAKPARGGVPNAMFVRAGVEELPCELEGVAGELTVLFPWGSLLRAVAAPEAAVLAGMRRVCASGATIRIALALPLERESASFARAGLEAISEEHLRRGLVGAYAGAGFAVSVRAASAAEITPFGTSWASRLVLERQRRFFIVSGEAR
jgi:16S rRNA (adenine(1408)-N(1))-methyltransferase